MSGMSSGHTRCAAVLHVQHAHPALAWLACMWGLLQTRTVGLWATAFAGGQWWACTHPRLVASHITRSKTDASHTCTQAPLMNEAAYNNKQITSATACQTDRFEHTCAPPQTSSVVCACIQGCDIAGYKEAAGACSKATTLHAASMKCL